MQLIDVLPVKSKKSAGFVARLMDAMTRPTTPEAESGLKALNSLAFVWNVIDEKTRENDYKRCLERLNEHRMKIFSEFGEISPELRYDAEEHAAPIKRLGLAVTDGIADMSDCSRIPLSDLRRAADALGYIILPFRLLDPAIYAGESKEMQEKIVRFGTTEPKHFDVYTLCPIESYNPVAHALYELERSLAKETRWDMDRSRERYQLYGRGFEGHLLGTLITITWTYVKESIDMDGREGPTLKRVGDHYQGPWISARKSLLKEPFGVKDSAASKEWWKLTSTMASRMTKEREKFAPRDLEPVMFALPASTLLTGEFDAMVGPCWGPDLPREMLEIVKASIGKGS
jgi:hypothetical protein